MARITVEDCLDNVDNRFELVLLASKRARNIAIKGATPKVAEENDKPTVLALREIAAGLVTPKNVEDFEGIARSSADEPTQYVEAEQIIEFSPRSMSRAAKEQE